MEVALLVTIVKNERLVLREHGERTTINLPFVARDELLGAGQEINSQSHICGVTQESAADGSAARP